MQPYTSLVRHGGNRELFLFLEMAIISQRAGVPLHFHVEGLRGTGKTTIIRAARGILPTITRIKGCLYNCDPQKPHCPDHRYLSREAVANLGVEEIPMPFLEISPSAKIGTVVGTIDLARITNPQQPEAALLPGTVPQAHRGILFVDEINRLADTSPELVDVLLDVMGTKPGRLQIEESGLPRTEIPVQVSLWAASNPDEDPGSLEDIRRQLSDRFDFLVEMGRPALPQTVVEMLAEKGKQDHYQLAMKDRELLEELEDQYRELKEAAVGEGVCQILASLYTKFNLESLRAVEALQYGSRVHAVRQGRKRVQVEDLLSLTPAVLRHRVEPGKLSEILQYLKSLSVEEQNRETVSIKPAEERSPGQGQGESKHRPPSSEGPLRKFLESCRDKMKGLLRRGARGGSGSRGRNPGGGGPPRKQGNRSQGEGMGQGQSQIMDPNKTSITAPPRPARPLFELASQGDIFPQEQEGESVIEN